jgi:hypothetical protein
MARVVVIASAEIDEPVLDGLVDAGDELHVVVPAVEQSKLEWLTNDEGRARAAAEGVGEQIGRDAPAEPASLTVKPDTPLQAVVDAVAEFRPDRIVVAVRTDDSSWLEEEGDEEWLPAEIDGIPLTRVTI